MTSGHLTDRMPDVRHGRDAWTESDQAHLAACVDCRTEWRVVSMVRTPNAVGSLDPESVAAGVLSRLRHSPAVIPIARRPRWRGALIGLAAAASIAVAFLVWPDRSQDPVAWVPSREATMLPELDALLDAELEVLLAHLAPPQDQPIGVPPRLGDLTDEELEHLLEEVEG